MSTAEVVVTLHAEVWDGVGQWVPTALPLRWTFGDSARVDRVEIEVEGQTLYRMPAQFFLADQSKWVPIGPRRRLLTPPMMVRRDPVDGLWYWSCSCCGDASRGTPSFDQVWEWVRTHIMINRPSHKAPNLLSHPPVPR